MGGLQCRMSIYKNGNVPYCTVLYRIHLSNFHVNFIIAKYCTCDVGNVSFLILDML